MTRSGRLAVLLSVASLAFAGIAAAAPVTRNLQFLAQVNEFPPVPATAQGYSACWSYVHGDGREYAILGTYFNGTAIYNVTNPAAPYRVGLIPGPFSAWREAKSYRNWIYVVTEGSGAGAGLQIIRMTDPENPVLVGTYTTSFVRSHTIAVDTTRALLICNGTNNGSGQATGMRILSIANPEAPVQVGWWPGGAIPVATLNYVHDCVPIGTTLYASSIYSGIERVFDFTNPALPVQVNSWTYPGAFSHNSWPSADGKTLYVTDETASEPLKIFDITNVMAPQLVNGITANPKAIVHNAHVLGDELYLSNYSEGIRVLDISDPLHPAEFASADSYFGPSGGFNGVWEVCPYFPSGIVIASDMQSGLYIYQPVRDYGTIRAKVEYEGGAPAAGVDVYVTTQGDSLVTPADGIVQFAPSPGMHTVTARKFGYDDASATLPVSAGLRDTVVLTLVAKPTSPWSGRVRDANTLAGLYDAEIGLEYTEVHAHTDVTGLYSLGPIPQDLYAIGVHRPGYAPIEATVGIGPGFTGETYRLVPAADYDDLEANSGWIVGAPGDDATTGLWVRVEPLGTGAPQPAPALQKRLARSAAPGGAAGLAQGGGPGLAHEGHEEDGAIPGDVQPEFDRTPSGTMCYVTGQGTDPSNIGQNDVDGGHTTLTSRTFDMAGMAEPTFGFWRWFYASGLEDDWFRVYLSNDGGASWVLVSHLSGGYYAHWEEITIPVNDYLPATSAMRIRFAAADSAPGDIVEAAVDDVIAYDAATSFVGVSPGFAPSALRFGAPRPNPSRGDVALDLAIPAAGPVEVAVFDVHGRRVRVLEAGIVSAGTRTLRWDGRDARGIAAPAGLYFARAVAGERRAHTRILRMP